MRFARDPSRPSPLADPKIEHIWINAAARAGFRVCRTIDAYASSDGRGVISIGMDESLDADDAAAQLVFHELCHAITEGPEAERLPDWGLDSTGPRDVTREHACLRLQAHLADPYGLRALMAPTTEYRAYYQQLPAAPLDDDYASDGDHDSAHAIVIARAAAVRAGRPPWRAALDGALADTALALAARGVPDARPARHPLGLPLGPAGESCGSCAWLYLGGRGTPVERCRQVPPVDGGGGDGPRAQRAWPACARWEPPLDCQTCGACCREAYHSVTVSVRDPVVWRQPALIERHGHRFEIRRDGPRCAALVDRRGRAAAGAGGSGNGEPMFACTIYADRPQACRDFAAGGRNCLEARRRVGRSR
jgi:Fe-S-cluster containining protein